MCAGSNTGTNNNIHAVLNRVGRGYAWQGVHRRGGREVQAGKAGGGGRQKVRR